MGRQRGSYRTWQCASSKNRASNRQAVCFQRRKSHRESRSLGAPVLECLRTCRTHPLVWQLGTRCSRLSLGEFPDLQIPINFELNGFTYGGGATAAIGTKDYFATFDVNYSHTDFKQLDNSLFALVITPRFGAIINREYFKGEIHVGAMYQDTKQTVEVLLDQPLLGPIAVEVEQYEPNPWNLLFGGLWGIDERLQIMIEAGVGGREYLITGATVKILGHCRLDWLSVEFTSYRVTAHDGPNIQPVYGLLGNHHTLPECDVGE